LNLELTFFITLYTLNFMVNMRSVEQKSNMLSDNFQNLLFFFLGKRDSC